MPTVAKRKKKPVAGNPWPEKLRAIRERMGLTIEEAAAKVGVKPLTWYGWETPSQLRKPSASHAILIDLLDKGKL